MQKQSGQVTSLIPATDQRGNVHSLQPQLRRRCTGQRVAAPAA